MRKIDFRTAARSNAICLLALLLVACAGTQPAPERSRRANDPTGVVEPFSTWREIDVPLPPYPTQGNLVEFPINGPANFKFFIDEESVRVDDDGVVRYTLIARSSSGVDNVTFEGTRCETQEFKSYAHGLSDETWSPQREPSWRRIEKRKINGYRFSLYHDYLCPGAVPRRNAREVVLTLKRGRKNFLMSPVFNRD